MSNKQPQNESIDLDSDVDEKRTVQYLLNSPAYMSAMMRRQLLQEMLKKLPKPCQDRIVCLKNIQLEQIEIEAKFYEEVYALEKKYQNLYEPLYAKRQTILSGAYEPTPEEIIPKAGTVDEEEVELSNKLKEVSLEIRKNLKTVYPDDVKGIPDFWLTIFRSVELLSGMIQEHDEPVLKKLQDIRVVYAEEMSYTLEFHFAENEYFTNKVLTKEYNLKSKVDVEHPFGFEGPEIYKCTGCAIDWHKDKNLTVKTIKKKQKHKARGAVRTVNKQVPADSFFNFFNPPEANEEDDDDDMDTQSILSTDYEIGHFLRARLVPKAVLYYTGDIVDEDDDDDYDEEEEEEEEEDEDEEDSEEDGPRPPKGGGGGKHHKSGGGGAPKQNPAECQQQ